MEDLFIVDGKSIVVYVEKEVKNILWKVKGVEIIVECIGFYIFVEKLQVYFDVGVKKVLIFVFVGEMKIIVYNVNDDILDGNDIIVFVVLCIINCFVLMVKVLYDSFGIEVGMMMIIYVYIGIQLLVDGLCGKDLCVLCAAVENIIFYIMGAVKVIGLVILELSGKLKGYV